MRVAKSTFMTVSLKTGCNLPGDSPLMLSSKVVYTAGEKKKKKRKERKKLGHEFAARSVFESPRFCIRFGTRVSALSRNSLVLSESHLKGVFACR